MAAKKKTPLKKAAPKRKAVTPAAAPSYTQHALTARQLIEDLTSGLFDGLGGLSPATEFFPQDMVRAAHLLQMAKKAVEHALKAFDARLLDYREAGGHFEAPMAEGVVPGFHVTFKETSKVTPQWKAETLKLGERLADLTGEPFDEKAFAQSIAATYAPTVSVKPTLLEAAG